MKSKVKRIMNYWINELLDYTIIMLSKVIQPPLSKKIGYVPAINILRDSMKHNGHELLNVRLKYRGEENYSKEISIKEVISVLENNFKEDATHYCDVFLHTSMVKKKRIDADSKGRKFDKPLVIHNELYKMLFKYGQTERKNRLIIHKTPSKQVTLEYILRSDLLN